jgi:hypothetical protein
MGDALVHELRTGLDTEGACACHFVIGDSTSGFAGRSSTVLDDSAVECSRVIGLCVRECRLEFL